MRTAIRHADRNALGTGQDGTDRARRHCSFRKRESRDGQCDDRAERRPGPPGSQPRPLGRHQPDRPLRAGHPACLRRRLGNRSRNCRRSRPRCRWRSRAPSSRATSRPTSPSTARSIPIAAASMAASTASRGRPTAIWACRRGWISNRSCSPSRTRRGCSTRSCRRKATSRAPSPSAPTPIPTSRSRSSGASCAKSSKCWTRATIRSASSPSRRW